MKIYCIGITFPIVAPFKKCYLKFATRSYVGTHVLQCYTEILYLFFDQNALGLVTFPKMNIVHTKWNKHLFLI